jgi:hypothetical protein
MRIKNKTPKSEMRNSKSEMGRPMLFAQNPAKGGTPGHNPGILEMSVRHRRFPPFVKGGQGGFFQGVSKQIPLFPPFSKGDLKPAANLRISSK